MFARFPTVFSWLNDKKGTNLQDHELDTSLSSFFFFFFFLCNFSSNIDCRIIAPAFRMLVGKISTDNG